MFNNSNKTTKHSVNKCSVLFNKFRKCLVRTASIITCTAIVATSVTPAFAAGITSGTTAASSYVISNGTTAAKSSVISNEVSTDTSVSWPQAPDITCESAILVDADTGSILYEKDAHRKCYPASTTKILTGLLTIENCNLSDTLTFSTAAANSINPIEDANLGMKAGEELTVENIKKHTRFHPRCGTSFLLFVMIVSILLFALLPRVDMVILRVLMRLALLPAVAGISFEIIKFAGRSKSKWVAWLSKPGLWLQKLTTREPDASQIEVAIESMKPCIPENKEDDRW